jgi:hypothetical protein
LGVGRKNLWWFHPKAGRPEVMNGSGIQEKRRQLSSQARSIRKQSQYLQDPIRMHVLTDGNLERQSGNQGSIYCCCYHGWLGLHPTWREELYDDAGPILQEMEAGQCREWKEITERSRIYKSYWAQRTFLILRCTEAKFWVVWRTV